jgi:hypothetical protein
MCISIQRRSSRCRILTKGSAVALCLLLALLSGPRLPAADAEEPFVPGLLVRARVTRVERVPGWDNARFVIDHVYSGAAALKGKTFSSSFWLDQGGLSNPKPIIGSEVHPLIRDGEVGIWHLECADKDDTLMVNIHNSGDQQGNGLCGWSLALPVPARRIIGLQDYSWNGRPVCHIHYPTAAKWAEVVESVYGATGAERPKLLRQHIGSDNPYVAAWAVRILARYKPGDLGEFLEKQLDNPRLSVAAQVMIDEVLCETDRKHWTVAKRRAALLEHWVSGEVIENREVMMIVAHLQSSLKYRCDEKDQEYQNIDWPTYLAMMEKWVLRHYLSPEVESRLFDPAPRSGYRVEESNKYIAGYALHLLEDSKDPLRQAYGAVWLSHTRSLSADELSKLQELKGKTKNPRVLALLDDAIQRANPPAPPRP